MATRYTDIATEQQVFLNAPGGGITTQFSPSAQFNDPALQLGQVMEVTATYTMLGNEAANDLINIYLAQPGSLVTPTGSATGTGIATTATISVGDDDTTGTTGPNAGAADQARYSASIDVHANQQTTSGSPVSFVGGNSLTQPYFIGSLAIESSPNGGTIAGSWIQAKFLTLVTPVAGKVLVFRLKVIQP